MKIAKSIYKVVLISLLLLFTTSAFVQANATVQTIRTTFNDLERDANAKRAQYIALGDRYYKQFSRDKSASGADYALLYAGKSYKASHIKFNNNDDRELALKYFRDVYTIYNTDASAEAYLESAGIYSSRGDLASAKFVLNRVVSRHFGTEYEGVAKGLLAKLEAESGSGRVDLPAPVIVTPAVNPSDVNPPGVSPIDNIVASIESMPHPDGLTVIQGIRYFSADDYTRIVIETNQSADIYKHWLKEDPSIGTPPRLFIDISNSAVDVKVAKSTEIKDGLVRSVRWAYNKPNVTRVVLDSEAIQDFTVFQMSNPDRIVIDVSGKAKVATATGVKPPSVNITVDQPNTTSDPDGANTLASTFGLKIKTVVIDPGHGGKDPGATYYNMREKDITLEISKYLKELLEQDKNLKVYLTRSTDVFIPLEERTAIANKHKADLFISVHINAARNVNAAGIETYVLNHTKDKNALEVAAFENQATTKAMSDLQGILKDIMLNSKLEESLRLAGFAQDSMVKTLGFPTRKDLGVKQAPFYVLVGAKMPSILVEAGFMSNKDEAALLATTAYRKNLAKGLHKGIDAYIKKYNK